MKVTPEGQVKVLDFGLAKALAEEAPAGETAVSPTLSYMATRAGTILGTAAYMSPEQARGRPIDRRTDIWAFGCVLYEMLAGKQAFPAETISDAIAGILAREPDWAALPAETPERVRELLRRCLQKDLGKRLRHIDDAPILLDEAPPPPAPILHPGARWRALPWAVAALGLALGAGLAAWSLLRAPKPASRVVTRLVAPIPQISPFPFPAISRDATRMAFIAGSPARIHVRFMDQLEAKPIAGTDQANLPFFSPDGQWIGFQQPEGKLKKVQVVGGPTMTLCDLSGPYGASRGADGNIIFGGAGGAGLARVSAAGGKPEVLTTPDSKKGEVSHRFPEILPGGEAVLFTIGAGGTYDDAKIAVLLLASREQRVLVEGGTNPRYVPTGDGRSAGHLVYWRAGSLFAVPFDLGRLQVTGSPVPILEGVSGITGLGYANYSFSDSGTLVYVPGGAEASNVSMGLGEPARTGAAAGGAPSSVLGAAAVARRPARGGQHWLFRPVGRLGVRGGARHPRAADPSGSQCFPCLDPGRQAGHLLQCQRGQEARIGVDALRRQPPAGNPGPCGRIDQISFLVAGRQAAGVLQEHDGHRGHLPAAVAGRPETSALRANAGERVRTGVLPGRPLDRLYLAGVGLGGGLRASRAGRRGRRSRRRRQVADLERRRRPRTVGPQRPRAVLPQRGQGDGGGNRAGGGLPRAHARGPVRGALFSLVRQLRRLRRRQAVPDAAKRPGGDRRRAGVRGAGVVRGDPAASARRNRR